MFLQWLAVSTAFLALCGIWMLAWRVVLGQQLMGTGPLAFLMFQSVNVAGLIVATDYASDASSFVWPWVALSGLLSLVVGAAAASAWLRFDPRVEIPVWRDRPITDDFRIAESRWLVLTLLVISVAVGAIFVSRIGYNTLIQSLQDLLQSGAVDRVEVSRLRSDATRGGYNAAGYASQFTSVILPALLLLVYVSSRIQRRRGWRYLVLAVALVDVYFVTAVGGRSHLISALFMAALLLAGWSSPLPRVHRLTGWKAVLLLGALMTIFGFTTLLQGRSDTSPADVARNTTVGFWNRVGGDYSRSQLAALDVVRDDAPVLGSHWTAELQTVLPGRSSDVIFDEQLHLAVYGHARGNLPLDPWGSYFYNWGYAGVVGVSFLIGAGLQFLTVTHLIRRERTLTRIVLMSMVGYLSAELIGPYSVLLNGMLTLLILTWIMDVASSYARTRSRQVVSARHRGLSIASPSGPRRNG